MDKTLDLNKTIYELSNEYPELINIMDELGFKEISKPGMLATAGRFMTIPKGAAMKRIDINKVLEKLAEQGFTVTGLK